MTPNLNIIKSWAVKYAGKRPCTLPRQWKYWLRKYNLRPLCKDRGSRAHVFVGHGYVFVVSGYCDFRAIPMHAFNGTLVYPHSRYISLGSRPICEYEFDRKLYLLRTGALEEMSYDYAKSRKV